MSMAQLLLESMESEWDPDKYHDTHREKVEALIEAKRQGNEIVTGTEEAPAATKVVDLMEVLSASIDSVKSQRTAEPVLRHAKKPPASGQGHTDQEGGQGLRRPGHPGQAGGPVGEGGAQGQAGDTPAQGVLTGGRPPVRPGRRGRPRSATRPSTSSAVKRSGSGSTAFGAVGHLLPGDRGRHRGLGPGPQRVGGHGGLGRVVLAPVDQHLAPAQALAHVGHHQLGVATARGSGPCRGRPPVPCPRSGRPPSGT